MKTGIYKITNPNGAIYIGQSSDLENRLEAHINGRTSMSIKKLQKSYITYGVENHSFEILEICKFEQLNIKERYWQDHYHSYSENNLNVYKTKPLSKITEKKQGRPLKWDEQTKVIGFKVPISKAEIIKEAVNNFIIKFMLDIQKKHYENLKIHCGCIIENGLLRRSKNSKCKLTKSEH